MPTYRVTFDTTGREVYLIDAADEDDARNRALEDGELLNSEVLDTDWAHTREETSS